MPARLCGGQRPLWGGGTSRWGRRGPCWGAARSGGGCPGRPRGSARLSAECVRGNGESYRGSRRVAAGGAPCLNWRMVRNGPGAALPAGGSGAGGALGGAGGAAAALTARRSLALDEDHNSCRNPDGHAAPWCYVQGATGIPERRSCDIAQCSGKSGRRRSLSLPALPGLPSTAGAGFVTRVGSPRRTNNPGLRQHLPRKHRVPSASHSPPCACTSASQPCRAPPLQLCH